MANIQCNIVSRPNEDSDMPVRTSGSTDVFIRGSGENTYTCYNCNHVLIQDVYDGQMRGVILKCPICETYNAVP